MELLLHYVWKHKMFPLKPLKTVDGMAVEVIDSGLHNHDAGPDFFNAKVKIGGTLWVGNVEIHDKASDWFAHKHDLDECYNNVILHVCGCVDTVVTTERLEQKTEAIKQRVKACDGSWEAAYFVTLARNYGFGINGEAFEQWALSLPLQVIAHHRDNLFQIEALFLGQAGLLNIDAVSMRHRDEVLEEGYFSKLQHEYIYLQHKFNLKPIDFHLWRFLRLRPQNFPHIRIVQLAQLYAKQQAGLSQLLDCTTVKAAMECLRSSVTLYWQTHYSFGISSEFSEKQLSTSSLQLLIINTVVPILFAYGRHVSKETFCERAFDFLEQLRPENNHIVRMWRDCGLQVMHAGDSQGLIQLKNEYCDKKNCLQCRIGYKYLKQKL